jgi:nitroimidazol reductase NimA-like FMN-containing flavoprotein (pyridoxamine 5'-phosphate oxidase superfamily)
MGRTVAERMKEYHMRRQELEIKSNKKMRDIIAGQECMTIAMCKGREPYLVTVTYAYDSRGHSFYFHCAPVGKKIDYLKANPIVWGQVLEDLGYVTGECEHNYRTVMFRGKAEFIVDVKEKRRALGLMIDKLEKKPIEARKRLITESSLEKASIVRVKAVELSGKESVHRKG